MVVVDLDGGARIEVPTTDPAAGALGVGAEVRLVLRRTLPGFPSRYAWKARALGGMSVGPGAKPPGSPG